MCLNTICSSMFCPKTTDFPYSTVQITGFDIYKTIHFMSFWNKNTSEVRADFVSFLFTYITFLRCKLYCFTIYPHTSSRGMWDNNNTLYLDVTGILFLLIFLYSHSLYACKKKFKEAEFTVKKIILNLIIYEHEWHALWKPYQRFSAGLPQLISTWYMN